MSFNFSHRVRLVAVLLTTFTFGLLSGCTSGEFRGASQASAKADQERFSKADPFDSYYGSPPPKVYGKDGRSPFRPDAPTRYIVKKGDTLWGIARKFLRNPAYWPEVWDKNQRIKNPHRIYPGDELFIYQGSGASSAHKLVPRMRVIRKSIIGQPISTLDSFLTWPRVLDENVIERAPYIVAADGANMLLEKDKVIYIKDLRDRAIGREYAIFRPSKDIVDPRTGRLYGREVIYNGVVSITRPSTHAEVATGLVEESIREIRRGDRLLPVKDYQQELDSPITIPQRKIRADVIALFDAKMISGQYQVVTINKGKRQGMRVGYTVGIYSPGRLVDDPIRVIKGEHKFQPSKPVRVSIPPSRVGTAIIYKVSNNISYALLHKTAKEVRYGYRVGNP